MASSLPPPTTTTLLSQRQQQHGDYRFRPISSLSPGPQRVLIKGLVTNLSSYTVNSSSAQAARGCLRVLVWDGSGEILVKLWYADTNYDDIVRLGQMLKIYTTHISSSVTAGMVADKIRVLPACLVTSVFPEKDSGCAVEALNESSTSFQDNLSGALCQLDTTTVQDLFHGAGDEKPVNAIFVVVLNIGKPQTVTMKPNVSFEVLDITIADASCLEALPHAAINPAYLSLSTFLFSSVSSFVPKKTALLIIHPKLLSPSRRRIKLSAKSQVVVNPCIPESALLKSWMENVFSAPPTAKRDQTATIDRSVSIFSEISLKQSLGNIPRKQYTFTLLLQEVNLRQQRMTGRPAFWRKFHRDTSFVGYISALVTKISLVELYMMGQLFGGVCSECNAEVFANTPMVEHMCQSRPCARDGDEDVGRETRREDQDCEASLNDEPMGMYLSWNSQLLSGLSDETGGLCLEGHTTGHNLCLTEQAMYGLTGLKKGDFNSHYQAIDYGSETMSLKSHDESESITRHNPMLPRLLWVEKQILWARVTMVIGWTKERRLVERGLLKDASDVSTGHEQDYANDAGRVVVLDVLS